MCCFSCYPQTARWRIFFSSVMFKMAYSVFIAYNTIKTVQEKEDKVSSIVRVHFC